MRSKEFDKFLWLISKWSLGLFLNMDSSPIRLFSADRACRNEDVLVRRMKLVDSRGNATTFTPRASLTGKIYRGLDVSATNIPRYNRKLYYRVNLKNDPFTIDT